MSFAHPLILCALALPGWLLWRTWHRAGNRVALPFDHGHQGSGNGMRILIDAAESLPPMILAVVIVLLAEPQRTGEPKTKRSLTNIEFCVDVSGSMTTPFGDGTRYDASMKAINEFLDFRTGDAFGLTFFGNNVLHWVPLTSDVSAFRCAPPFMKPDNLPPWFGGTMIGKALLSCKDVLISREEGDRMIVLVTDGMSFDLADGSDEEVSRTLVQNNIVVYAVHVSDEEVPAPVVTITSRTGGEVFTPGDPQALKAVFKRIDEMRQTRLEKTVAKTLDNFGPVCITGLSLCALCGLAMFGARYTPVVTAPAEIAAAVAAVVVLLAEVLHARRCRLLAPLAFGPSLRASPWARPAPGYRVAAASALVWGLVTLWLLPPKVHTAESFPDSQRRNLLLVLDVSPSMRLRDAGPERNLSRSERASDVLTSFFQRVPAEQYLISVIACYNGSKPVVVGTKDMEVVRNVLTDLPMHYAFRAGKTDLFSGIAEAARTAEPWRPRSTLLVMLTDGDTVPSTGMPKMPESVADVLVVGVGDPRVGTFIDGRQSRQDASTLRQIAARLGGSYHDGNEKHLSTDFLQSLTFLPRKAPFDRLTRREYALIACALGSLSLAALPVALHHFGTRWRPGVPVRPRREGSRLSSDVPAR